MKETIKEYKEIFISFLKNKKYLYTVLFVAILSYGFTITHYTIGPDDLCFDRYVQGTYILSAKRWGTWLLYNILNITSFSPFWLDAIVALLMIVVATMICTFIKRILKEKVNIWPYIIFSTLFISNPMIFRFFSYQSTNLAVVVSNAMVIALAIMLFENYFNWKNKQNYLGIGLALIIPLSMYEASAQTYLLIIFMACCLKAITEDIKLKQIVKIIGLSILTVAIGSIGYFIFGKILLMVLEKNNMLQTDFAEHGLLWFHEVFLQVDFATKLQIVYDMLIVTFVQGIKNYLPVTVFVISSILAILLETILAIKTRKYTKLILLMGVIFTNFILIIIQGDIKYRIQYSWFIATAFLCMYIYISIDKNKIIKYIASTIIIILLIIQTRELNQQFYAEYKKYEKEKSLAAEIARDIGKLENSIEKPLVYILTKINESYYVGNSDNGAPVLIWGKNAFYERGTETTKFINNLGYNFKYATNDIYRKAMLEYENLEDSLKDNYLIELEECIIVNLDKYMSV